MRTVKELANVRMGDMTREEQRMIIKRSCEKLQAELNYNRAAIEAALADPPESGRRIGSEHSRGPLGLD